MDEQGSTPVGAWIEESLAHAPAALTASMRQSLASSLNEPVGSAASACLSAADVVLARLLATGSTDRATAVELLTADALVTSAFEAAAAEPSTIVELAEQAMQRIAERSTL